MEVTATTIDTTSAGLGIILKYLLSHIGGGSTSADGTAELSVRLQVEDLNRAARSYNAAVPTKTSNLRPLYFLSKIQANDTDGNPKVDKTNSPVYDYSAAVVDGKIFPKNIEILEGLKADEAEKLLDALGIRPTDYQDSTDWTPPPGSQNAPAPPGWLKPIIRQIREAVGLAAYPLNLTAVIDALQKVPESV